MRAARSYAYNLHLQERVNGRLERARTLLESYFLLRGVSSAQLGAFRVDLDDGKLSVAQVSTDGGWEQLQIEDILTEVDVRQELGVGYRPQAVTGAKM